MSVHPYVPLFGLWLRGNLHYSMAVLPEVLLRLSLSIMLKEFATWLQRGAG